jgi:hypothetical protein
MIAARLGSEPKDTTVDEPCDNLSWTRCKSPRRSVIRERLGELLSLVRDMLLIGFASIILAGMMGMRDHVTLSALGISLYISCKHFSLLRGEIAFLRYQVESFTTQPGCDCPDMHVDERGEEWSGWSGEDSMPATKSRAAVSR